MDDAEFQELLRLVCTRDLSDESFPVVHLGTVYTKHHVGEEVEYRTLVLATGVAEDGELEPLGIGVGDSEDPDFWSRFLLSLRARGLKGAWVIASGDHGGLEDAVNAVFPGARRHSADTLEELADDAPALLDLRIEDGGDEDAPKPAPESQSHDS